MHLENLTRLRALWLSDSRLTDAELIHLKGLTDLEWLDLGNTRVTDAVRAAFLEVMAA